MYVCMYVCMHVDTKFWTKVPMYVGRHQCVLVSNKIALAKLD
jgi:hypothetical protein